jgi:hypothetical protein
VARHYFEEWFVQPAARRAFEEQTRAAAVKAQPTQPSPGGG